MLIQLNIKLLFSVMSYLTPRGTSEYIYVLVVFFHYILVEPCVHKCTLYKFPKFAGSAR